jgi:hypothetical protein
MQHARRNDKGAILSIDSNEGEAGGETHALQLGVSIKKKDFEANLLEGSPKVLPLLES